MWDEAGVFDVWQYDSLEGLIARGSGRPSGVKPTMTQLAFSWGTVEICIQQPSQECHYHASSLQIPLQSPNQLKL
jgi:hypothetical protein